MSYTRLNPKAASQFTVSSTTETIAANSTSVEITAPSVSGYSFLCWLGVSTDGWVGDAYVQNMGASSTKVWSTMVIGGSTPSVKKNSGNVNAFALYVKN